ncbi:halocyanin domain-containing protein [Halorhabdus sp. CBA1104]|uniref:halocyanin domain-containing protein n=1 Tax=unclassified Halorhabdus TaxID=2621901 RepID=UPI0012B1B3F6|nr:MULTISPECIES: halocyanin domain-containing protein [unclassified Halorhabdus]QGN06970.1 halocyanin domain-containing protein [Halorhabdus sp. CBA1104]
MSGPSTDGRTRRDLLRAGAAAGTAAAGLATTGSATAQAGVDFDGWFSDVSNYDGIVDRRGQDEVTVTVGVQANGSNWGFGPAAVRVDPGTTVVWEWNGKGGAHNVVAENDDGYSSGEAVDQAGTTFEQTFEETGISKYYCDPHLAVGMKGAIVVGDMGASAGGDGGGSDGGLELSQEGWLLAGSFGLAVASPILFAAFLRFRGSEEAVGPSEETRKQLQRVAEHDGPPVAEEAPVEEPKRKIEHEEYDPWGTLSLVIGYLVLVVTLWVFMYFVEFLGRGPTVIG